MKKTISLLILYFTSIIIANSQYYSTGVEPYSVKWKQINTNKHLIIFPSDAESAAVKFANLINVIDSTSSNDYFLRNKRIKVVVHNHSILSNGYVAWAPKRMEIITHQPYATSPQPWLSLLATHETRHYAQVSNLYDGVFYPLYLLFGEQAIGAAAGFVPMWYLEGDAVSFETATSNSGRGRQAQFYSYYRSHYLTYNTPFIYDKWLLGSYKDNIPDHYALGYQLVTFGKLKYGNNIWANTYKYITYFPFSIFPFYLGLKIEAGVSRKNLHKETFSYLDHLWTNAQDTGNISKIKNLYITNTDYAEYRYSHPINDTLLFSYKTCMSEIPSFVIIDIKNNKESILFNPGYLTSKPSFCENIVYWSEYKPHKRWEMQDYSIIKSLDIKTKEDAILLESGKYSCPVSNSADSVIYAISRLDSGVNQVIGFNKNRDITYKVIIPTGYDPYELFLSNDGIIYLATVTGNGKVILKLNGPVFETVYGPTYHDINSFSATGDLIFFVLTMNYKEDIFCYNLKNNRLFKVTNTHFGSKDPFYNSDKNTLLFSDYSTKGYHISSTSFDTLEKSVLLPYRFDNPFTQFLDSTQQLNIDEIKIPSQVFQIKNYRGPKTLFNVHSWMPFFTKQRYLAINESSVKPGLTLMSQNLTGSSFLILAYGYDNDHNFQLNYEYQGFWPKLYLNYETYSRKGDTCRINSLTSGVMIPFQINQNHYSTYFTSIFSFTHTNDLYALAPRLIDKNIQYLEGRLVFSRMERMAVRDIRPKRGVFIDIYTATAPFEKVDVGNILSVNTKVYLPGLLSNHSLMTSLSYQKQWYKEICFSNKIVFPRGYDEDISSEFKTISIDYLFPLFYPDLAIGSISYIKRLSLDLFFDFAETATPMSINNTIFDSYDNLHSFGYEAHIDLHFFRTRFPFRFKFQQGWKGKDLELFYGFALTLDIYGAFGITRSDSNYY